MSLAISELAYPVIALGRGGFVEVREDEDTMTTATSHQLKTRWLQSMTLVDSNGNAVKVKEVRFVSGKGSFRGYYSPLLDRIVRVEVTLDDHVSEMPLEELKKKVLSFQRKSGRSMDPGYAREVLQNLEDAQSVGELIERFQPQMGMREFYEMLKPSLKKR